MISRELLLERRRQLEADALAISGAIQQVDWTLDKMDEGESSDSSSEDPSEAGTFHVVGPEEG